MTDHKSDCAVHNEPAMEIGPCDCGAENAQVQDDARPNGSNADKWTMFLSDYEGAPEYLAVQVAEAIEEAEQRGMMRAIEEIAIVEKDMMGKIKLTPEQDSFRYGAGYGLGRAARAIERAAKEER